MSVFLLDVLILPVLHGLGQSVIEQTLQLLRVLQQHPRLLVPGSHALPQNPP